MMTVVPIGIAIGAIVGIHHLRPHASAAPTHFPSARGFGPELTISVRRMLDAPVAPEAAVLGSNGFRAQPMKSSPKQPRRRVRPRPPKRAVAKPAESLPPDATFRPTERAGEGSEVPPVSSSGGG